MSHHMGALLAELLLKEILVTWFLLGCNPEAWKTCSGQTKERLETVTETCGSLDGGILCIWGKRVLEWHPARQSKQDKQSSWVLWGGGRHHTEGDWCLVGSSSITRETSNAQPHRLRTTTGADVSLYYTSRWDHSRLRIRTITSQGRGQHADLSRCQWSTSHLIEGRRLSEQRRNREQEIAIFGGQTTHPLSILFLFTHPFSPGSIWSVWQPLSPQD